MSLILQIAVQCPLRQTFDYLPDQSSTNWQAGLRVKIPFGSRELIGIIVKTKKRTNQQTDKLKVVLECLDQTPLISTDLLSLTQWLANYYHHPIGDCFQTVLPKKIRLGENADLQTEIVWSIEKQTNETKVGTKQQKILTLLKQHDKSMRQSDLYQQMGQCRSSLKSLEEKSYKKNRSLHVK